MRWFELLGHQGECMDMPDMFLQFYGAINFFIPATAKSRWLKGIDRSFKLRGESRLI
jgi:hypothetical protein